MIEIRRIKPDEGLVAKRGVYRVAQDVFNDSRPLHSSNKSWKKLFARSYLLSK